ncbi:tigger transposable element-derived protein 1-like [Leucoraja erinacea]|uniref:tigger transposable element-derived protein 1-like n=1 Tax=Leucoraja erinaceus TaxID=7782 RepID=UPI0024584EF9|nr:tigger transposable element-derived protein 1-like [Leucoraja erinacea]XP_055521163.1 tigger transposable element-derived protein 1-like [Leucoraja erinacea]XP_055521164.1 tigger transposable element-derived protein 1-like [Leucoraja erinacea]XP_055521165.1 tigger transposable element-derived protein 1-like [Leucoraja erinacea]
MSTNCPSVSSASGVKKKTRIPLKMKLKIIALRERGKRVIDIARELGIPQSTISTICKDKTRIRDAAKSSASVKSTVIRNKRAGPIGDIERLLVTWMEDQIQKHKPFSLSTIQAMARSFFNTLKENSDDPTYPQVFTASPGWFQRFKRRNNFNNVKISGEAASVNTEGAAAFKEELNRIIVDEKYLPEQIFNVDETCLFWKRMPEHTYIHQESKTMPGFKTYKDRVTLLLGGNVAGFKLKPLLIYHSENPRALKNVSTQTLPVHYRHNRKAMMTSALFADWYLNCFIPEAREYCWENKIPFRILLILDNAPGHPQHIGNMHPFIKVVYLPPSITALIQPMDQGVIATFKAYFLGQTFAQAVRATKSGRTLRDFWNGFNILNATRNIAAAWKDVTLQCMKCVWKKVMKTHVDTFKGFNKDSAVDNIVRNKILVLGNQLELDIDEEDIHELVDIEAEELSNEDLIELEEARRKEAEAMEEEVIAEALKTFTTKKLAEAFAAISSGIRMLEEMDINYERVTKTDRQIQDALACYREIYNEMNKE